MRPGRSAPAASTVGWGDPTAEETTTTPTDKSAAMRELRHKCGNLLGDWLRRSTCSALSPTAGHDQGRPISCRRLSASSASATKSAPLATIVPAIVVHGHFPSPIRCGGGHLDVEQPQR